VKDRSIYSIALWGVVALGGALLAFVLANSEYRHNFLTGSGFAYGAVIAAIALGVVLTYRGSGVVNLANGAIAMYIAYIYTVLRLDGNIFLPPIPNPLKLFGSAAPNIPTEISLGDSMGFWPALLISLGFCILLGLILHFLVFKPLRTAPPLAKVIASVGVFVFLQATIIRRFATTPKQVPPLQFVHNTTHIKLGVVTVPEDQLFVAVLVIVLATLLWALFRFTRFGLATRAAAENEKGALVLGFSPDFLAGTNWVLSMVITGMLGVFVASTQSLVDPSGLAVLIVPALTAALVGSFSSFGRTTAAAFLLGMQIPLVQYLSNKSWFPKSNGSPWPGFEYLLPLLVIVVVLFLAGSSLPERGAISSGRLPFSPTPAKWALRIAGPALAILAAVAGTLWFNPDYRLALSNTLIGVIICLSVVIITGFVGQISLAQLSFSGIAAFTVSKLSAEHGWPFPWPILAGAFVALVLGLLVAIPALRVRGVNLAIVTLGFAVAVDHVVFANTSVTGGYNGAQVKVPHGIDVNNTSQFHFLGLKIGDGLQPNPMSAMFVLVVVVLLCYAVANMRRSTTGRQMLATRSNERAAAAAGVNVSGTKLLAFAVSAFVAGIGGGVIAYHDGSVTADPTGQTGKWGYVASLIFFAFAYLGGISSVSGAIAGGLIVQGGLVFTLLEDKFGVPPGMVLVIGGFSLVLTAILNPEGIAGGLARSGGRLLERIRTRPEPPPRAPAGAAATEGAA
jgi:branched-chain amino acid transport system permease protein